MKSAWVSTSQKTTLLERIAVRLIAVSVVRNQLITLFADGGDSVNGACEGDWFACVRETRSGLPSADSPGVRNRSLAGAERTAAGSPPGHSWLPPAGQRSGRAGASPGWPTWGTS